MAKRGGKTKIRKASDRSNTVEPLVNPFAARHGRYEDAKVVDLDGEIGGRRMATYKVMLNRGGTAVDRWISSDRTGQFGEPQQAAIRYSRNLWRRADGGLQAVDPAAVKADAPLGWSQHEALAELGRMKEAIPRRYWDVYENVCRFDEEAGVAGSSLATNARSAIDAAKTTVAFVASVIAMRGRF